ncbi:myb-like protein D [Oppia nitens]|uniref:myb-like protein D n=1 Tax=Oppia nitens TaxID=1686743 RepID=UPI0023DBF285|nr:myb-like protein D [Oppia nitens]
MDLTAAKQLRDKRNRILERETNELKDELCAMRHIVHLLDNIKRVSSDCINFLHLMVDAAIRTDSVQVDQLRDDVQELEEELKTWERKYQMMSSMSSSSSGTAASITLPNKEHNYSSFRMNPALKALFNNSHNNSNSNTTNNNNITANNSNNNSQQANDQSVIDDENDANDSMDQFEDQSLNGNYYDSDHNDDCGGGQSSTQNSMVLMPQELCEMSMETNDNDQILITSADASPTHGLDLDGSGLNDMSGKSLFECDWMGCDFKTNMRQRLVMHKRLHAGENLYSCDIQGCGYQSNYKGNIKIHKKHRHRIDSDDSNRDYTTTRSMAAAGGSSGGSGGSGGGGGGSLSTSGAAHTSSGSHLHQLSTHHSHNLSQHLTKNSNTFASNIIRKRKRKKKFRFTINRSNPVARPHVVSAGQLAREQAINNNNDDDDDDDDEAKEDRSEALFTCNIKGCSYRSKWKQCLTAHQLLHAGVKPFKCDHPGCNYRTNFKGNVNVHKRVHRESQYQCQVNGCQFSTPWKNSFNQHQRNHQLTTTTAESSPVNMTDGLNIINNNNKTNNNNNHRLMNNDGYEEQNSDENDFYDGLDDEYPEENSLSGGHTSGGDQMMITTGGGGSVDGQLPPIDALVSSRKVLQSVMPVTAVQQHISSTNNNMMSTTTIATPTMAGDHKNPMTAIQTNAQQQQQQPSALVIHPSLVGGVIKTIKSEI